MNDEKDTPVSDSRSEPSAAPEAATPAAAPAPRKRLRGRVALAGVGAALAVAGGVGGFALGHAAAGNDVDDASVVEGREPGHDDGDGFPGRPGLGDRGTRPDSDGTVPGDPDDSTSGDSAPDDGMT